MTFSEVAHSPIGTTAIHVSRTYIGCRATHWEKISKGVSIRDFYANTEVEARWLAEDYDKKRKELYAKWKNSRSAKRRDATLKK